MEINYITPDTRALRARREAEASGCYVKPLRGCMRYPLSLVISISLRLKIAKAACAACYGGPSIMNAIVDAHEILAAWPIGEVVSLREPGAGSINRTILVATASGRYALRAYRSPERAWAEREHAIIAFVRATGLPAVAPLPLPGGDTILERGGHCFALFPHAPGRQLARHELQEAEVAAMGSFLARLHLALADYPPERVQARPLAIDRPGALAAIERHIARIAALPARSASDEAIHERLEGQRAWIAAHPDASTDALALLPQQAIHGDYQEANLFFERGAVSAIIDWDQARGAT
jgi:Ser/Thr protein kinase RdoA (MazF antagonist)